jgi:hypothetical protein
MKNIEERIITIKKDSYENTVNLMLSFARPGISFTPRQIKKLKKLYNSGCIIKAQKYILNKLKRIQ